MRYYLDTLRISLRLHEKAYNELIFTAVVNRTMWYQGSLNYRQDCIKFLANLITDLENEIITGKEKDRQ